MMKVLNFLVVATLCVGYVLTAFGIAKETVAIAMAVAYFGLAVKYGSRLLRGGK